MKGLYDLLNYRSNTSTGKGGWMGNLKWYAEEAGIPLSYTFSTIPVEISDGEETAEDIWPVNSKRILLNMSIVNHHEILEYSYNPDFISVDTEDISFSMYFPIESYGTVMTI